MDLRGTLNVYGSYSTNSSASKEAFKATGRILNIPVTSARKNEVPSVLNYLTAPDVVRVSIFCVIIADFL